MLYGVAIIFIKLIAGSAHQASASGLKHLKHLKQTSSPLKKHDSRRLLGVRLSTVPFASAEAHRARGGVAAAEQPHFVN